MISPRDVESSDSLSSRARGSRGGHLFIVHGRIERVVHDVAVVPTASNFSVRGYWFPILGGDQPDLWRPPDWPPRHGFARAREREDVWFLNVGGRRSAGAEAIVERAVGVLRAVSESRPRPSRNRVKPLVALPVLGIAGGGLGQQRGEVVRALVGALANAARELDLDVVLVTPDRAVHGAAQHLRRETVPWSLPKRQLQSAQRLGQAARDGGLALFIGAGVSIPAGLPTWSGLLRELASSNNVDVDTGFDGLNALDQAQYLQRRIPDLGRDVAEIVKGAETPSLSHALLASLGCGEAVTTNYDRLYEKAVRMQRGRGNLATVLPWEPAKAGKPWVLKLHGDVEYPGSIVLTRQQFVSFDAQTRPAGALLQTLLVTRHVLFVGASLTDDNVIRLAYEVDDYRRQHGLKGSVGTLLDVDDDRVRRELWRGQLTWLAMSGATIAERSRTLEIFLDAVSAYASNDASWLLDKRFHGLLGVDEEIAEAARTLYRRASRASAEWQGVADALLAFGAASGEDEPEDGRRWRAELPT